jgi:hypothetical protein
LNLDSHIVVNVIGAIPGSKALKIILCICHGLNVFRDAVFEKYHKTIERRLPISDWHGPFFRRLLNHQVIDFFGRVIGWEDLSTLRRFSYSAVQRLDSIP